MQKSSSPVHGDNSQAPGEKYSKEPFRSATPNARASCINWWNKWWFGRLREATKWPIFDKPVDRNSTRVNVKQSDPSRKDIQPPKLQLVERENTRACGISEHGRYWTERTWPRRDVFMLCFHQVDWSCFMADHKLRAMTCHEMLCSHAGVAAKEASKFSKKKPPKIHRKAVTW